MFDAIEEALILNTKGVLTINGELLVRTVEALPGDLRDAQALRELASAAPAVYWAFLGGRNSIEADDIHINSVWGCYIVTDHASGHDARRRGDGRQIGAYDIMKMVLPIINGLTITGVGTANFKRVENLFSIRVDKVGAALYAATFEIPLPLDYELDLAGLNNFETYHAEHSLAPGADEPAAIDEITLEQ